MGALHATRTTDGPRWPRLAPTDAGGPLRMISRRNSGAAAWNMPVASRRNDLGNEAGVHLPFIAPVLWGVRVRAARRGLEFILPNPSGGRGVYVAAWNVVTGFASPSPHDTMLVGRLSGQEAITPADVRQVACSVALDGYAGHEAAAAARQAQAALQTASLRLRAQFLLALARRGGFHRPEDATGCLDRAGFNVLADRLGWRGPQLAEALQSLSLRYSSIATGMPSLQGAGLWPSRAVTSAAGRWGRLRSLVQRLRHSLAEEQCTRGGPDGILLARIMSAADRCIGQADRLLPQIDAMLADPLPLLEAWREGHDAAAWWLHALETAFDGWDRICLLWFDAQTPQLRHSLIPEMAARAWATAHGDGWTPAGPDAAPLPGEVERAGESEERRQLVSRNERIRTRELTLELAST